MNKAKIVGFAIGPIGSAILGFISLPILAWFFTAEDIGRISMLQVVISFAVILCSLGLDQAYAREYHETFDKARLLKTVIVPGLLLMFLGLICIFIYSPSLISISLFAIDNITFSLLVIFCLLCSYLSRFLSVILRMQEKGFAFSMTQILPKIIFLIVVGIYVFLNFNLDFYKLLIAQVLSIVLVFLIYIWSTRADWLPALLTHIDFINLKNMMSFGLPLIFGGVAYWALTAMDRIFLRNFSTFNELGIYSLSSSIAAVAGVVSSIFTTIWAPTVFKWAALEENLDKVDTVSQHVLAVVYFILCIGGVFSWVIPYLLPTTYLSAQYLIVACMVAPLFYMISETTAVGISISRKTGYSLLASCIAACVNAIGNYFLVPIWGAEGAAISTAVAFWVFVICRTEFCCLVWRPVPKYKLYFVTLILLSMAICFTLFGDYLGIWFVILWFILFIFGFFIFQNSIKKLILQVKQGF